MGMSATDKIIVAGVILVAGIWLGGLGQGDAPKPAPTRITSPSLRGRTAPAPSPVYVPPARRGAWIAEPDDPLTTNDESNDQPVGYFGTKTLIVSSDESGNTYTLDVEMEGFEVTQMFFPRGGWIEFVGCELDEDFTGSCTDEEGRDWQFEGE